MTVAPATPDMSLLSSELQAQLKEIGKILHIEDPVKIIDPNRGYYCNSLTECLELGYVELAEIIVQSKKKDVSDIQFVSLDPTIAKNGNWDIIKKVLDFFKTHAPTRLVIFQEVFQSENFDFISWWKDNYPEFPGSWLADCSLDYVKVVTTEIKLTPQQISTFLQRISKPEMLSWATKKFFISDNLYTDIKNLYSGEDLFCLISTHFDASKFEFAARADSWEYLKWCVARFGVYDVKKNINLSNCLSSGLGCHYVMEFLQELLELTEKDLLRDNGAFIRRSFSFYHIQQWLLSNFNFNEADISALTFDSKEQEESWFVTLLKAPASVRRYCKVEHKYKILAESCLRATREEEMDVVHWIFEQVGSDCFATSFLKEIQQPALEIGNIELLDLFRKKDKEIDAFGFNYYLFSYIWKPEVLDWLHTNISPIDEKRLTYPNQYDLMHFHPNVLVWLLQHDVITEESPLLTNFKLDDYVTKHIEKHTETVSKIFEYLNPNANTVIVLIKCDFVPDSFIVKVINDYSLPKHSMWFMLAAELDRYELMKKLVNNYGGQFEAWEFFTPKPQSLSMRHTLRTFSLEMKKLEDAAWHCDLDKNDMRNSLELAVGYIDEMIMGYEFPYQDVVRWIAVYYDLKEDNPIWKEMLNLAEKEKTKTFIKREIMKQSLTLKELAEKLSSGEIKVKCNVEPDVLANICKEMIDASLGGNETTVMKSLEKLIAK